MSAVLETAAPAAARRVTHAALIACERAALEHGLDGGEFLVGFGIVCVDVVSGAVVSLGIFIGLFGKIGAGVYERFVKILGDLGVGALLIECSSGCCGIAGNGNGFGGDGEFAVVQIVVGKGLADLDLFPVVV